MVVVTVCMRVLQTIVYVERISFSITVFKFFSYDEDVKVHCISQHWELEGHI